MMRKYILPAIATMGLLIAIGMVGLGDRSTAAAPQIIPSAETPYSSSIVGAGIIEASTENIAIGTAVPGIISEIYVKLGDYVKAGDPLFKVDDRELEAELLPALARVTEAEANLAKIQRRLGTGEKLNNLNSGAMSKEEFNDRRADERIYEANLEVMKATAAEMKLEVERMTVRALVNGRILQIKIRPGEFAQTGVLNPPLMILGDDIRLHVRVDVNEYDAARFRPETPAMAFLRGDPSQKIALKFERIEPYIIPKSSLTGDSTERTDTRVLQVIYSFDPATLPVYVGQQMDVFIQTLAVTPQNKTETH